MRTVVVQPLPGLLFRDPQTRELIPASGIEVQLNTFWRRAIWRGDVVEIKAAPKASATTKPTKRARRDQ